MKTLERGGFRRGGLQPGIAPSTTYARLNRLRKKLFTAVILSEAKNLALRIVMNIRDSSFAVPGPPAAPQNDNAYEFFRSL